MHWSVVANLPQCFEERFYGDDSCSRWQLAVAIDLLVERNSQRSVVEIHRDDIFVTQGQKVGLPFPSREPVPAVELNPYIARANRHNQLFGLTETVDERMALPPPQRHRAQVLEAQLLPVVLQDLRASSQTIRVGAKVLQVGELAIEREHIGAHTPNARAL